MIPSSLLALDAIARLDDGVPLPGDTLLRDAHDRHCQDSATRLELRLAWLAGGCVICGGEIDTDTDECMDCIVAADVAVERSTDV